MTTLFDSPDLFVAMACNQVARPSIKGPASIRVKGLKAFILNIFRPILIYE